MGNPKTKTVQTEDGPVVVRKLALGDYSELLRALNNLPNKIQEYARDKSEEELKNITWATFLPEIIDQIAKSVPELAAVLAVATDKDAKFFVEGDPVDALDVLDVVLELNDYERLIAAVKKVTARRGKAPDKAENADGQEPPTKP